MKLYGGRGMAPNPRRVHWVMTMKSIQDVEVVDVDLMKGEHRHPDYIAKAGMATVPALELDDGTTLTESVAICRYLESRHPEPNLFGRDAEETAVIEMWTRRAENLLASPFMAWVRHGHLALAALQTPQVPEVAEFGRVTGEAALSLFERRLDESSFIAADRVTMADIVAYIGIDFGRLMKFKVSDAYPRLTAWVAGLAHHPAAATA